MTQAPNPGRKDYFISIFIIGIFYFIFGFVTWLNGVLIPFLKISCELTTTQAYFVASAFYISYFVMALPSSWVLKKTGFKGGMAVGLFVMAAGSLIFIPAAMTRIYGLFLLGLFVQGTGLAILQTAVNPYITILGPIRSAARRISIMGICNKVAGVLGPLILGAIILKGTDTLKAQLEITTDVASKTILLDTLASRVILPYIVMAVVLVLLAMLVRFSPLPDVDKELDDGSASSTAAHKKNIFQFPHLILGFIAIFVYVGAEVIAGDTIIMYGQSWSIPMEQARIFTSYTLIAMVVGYVMGILFTPRIISQEKALGISAVLGLIFTAAALMTDHYISVMFIALLGFANAIMWPAIWPLAINGLGRFTKTGSAILIMGIAGGATLPVVYSRLGQHLDASVNGAAAVGDTASHAFNGSQWAYLLLIPCYLFILYYAFAGHKAGTRKLA